MAQAEQLLNFIFQKITQKSKEIKKRIADWIKKFRFQIFIKFLENFK